MGVSGRLSFLPGDFFKDPIPPAEVLIMGHILHDWNLNEKMHLIENAYRTLPTGGSFIVLEALIDDDRRENAFGLLMSLNMLIETPGGFDYTGADCSGVDEKGWFPRNSRRASGRSGFDGRGSEVASAGRCFLSFALTLSMQFVTSIKERDRDPQKGNDERNNEYPRKKRKQNRQTKKQQTDGYHDSRFERLQYAAVRESGTQGVTNAHCSRCRASGASAATG